MVGTLDDKMHYRCRTTGSARRKKSNTTACKEMHEIQKHLGDYGCQVIFNTIRLFHNPCTMNVNITRGLFSDFRVDKMSRRCKWVSRNDSRPVEEIFDWPTDCSSLKYENYWYSAASQEKTMLESCNLRCKNDGYFVTMHVWPISQNAAR